MTQTTEKIVKQEQQELFEYAASRVEEIDLPSARGLHTYLSHLAFSPAPDTMTVTETLAYAAALKAELVKESSPDHWLHQGLGAADTALVNDLCQQRDQQVGQVDQVIVLIRSLWL